MSGWVLNLETFPLWGSERVYQKNEAGLPDHRVHVHLLPCRLDTCLHRVDETPLVNILVICGGDDYDCYDVVVVDVVVDGGDDDDDACGGGDIIFNDENLGEE